MYSPCGRSGTSTATDSGSSEAGEIEEVAVGTVGVLDVVVAQPHGRRRHDRDRIRPMSFISARRRA
jgi:hypothetical protein